MAGHHGGAWKVAYADFVTAMIALFIVLWLMNTDGSVRKAVSSFFNSPSGPGKLTGTSAAGQGIRFRRRSPSGKASPTTEGDELLTHLAQELGGLPNRVFIPGHADSRPYRGDLYGIWGIVGGSRQCPAKADDGE